MICYADESSDESHSRVFAVGGVVGTEEMWAHLESQWQARTDAVPFHAKDCDSDQGDYAGFSHTDNKRLYADLVGLLADSGLGGYAVAIDLIAQREVFSDALDMSYYKGLGEVVEHMKNCADFNRQRVRFVFDAREESAFNAALWFQMLRGVPEWTPFIEGELTFQSSRTSARIQAADLFVREVMKAWDNRIGPVKRPMRKSWARLRETNRFHGEVLGLPWFLSLREQIPAMETQVGMSMPEYARWLGERNMTVDNMSNRLLFIQWLDKHDARQPNKMTASPAEIE